MQTENESTPPPVPAARSAESSTDLPWYIALVRKEKATMKGAPISFLMCVIICTILLGIGIFTIDQWHYAGTISGKDASIQAKQDQIDQLKWVEGLASNLTNVYQELNSNLKIVAASSSNSDIIINHYNEQVTGLKISLENADGQIKNLEGQLNYFTDCSRLPNILGDWGKAEFTNGNYVDSMQILSACFDVENKIWTNGEFHLDAGLTVVYEADRYMTNTAPDKEVQFGNAIDNLTMTNSDYFNRLQNEDLYLEYYVKPLITTNLWPTIESAYNRERALMSNMPQFQILIHAP